MNYPHCGALGPGITTEVMKSLKVIVEVSQNDLFAKFFWGAAGIPLQHIARDFIFELIRIRAIIIRNNKWI